MFVMSTKCCLCCSVPSPLKLCVGPGTLHNLNSVLVTMKYNPASGQFMLLILLTIPGLLQYFDSGDCFMFYRENSITIWLQSTNYPLFSPEASQNWWVFKLTFLPPLDTPLSFLFATLKRNIPTLSPYHSPSCLFLCYVWIILIDAHFSLAMIFSKSNFITLRKK